MKRAFLSIFRISGTYKFLWLLIL